MNKYILIFISTLLFTTSLYASYGRYSLSVEYKLVNACIDHKSFGGVSTSLREECIERVLEVEKEYSLSQIKRQDKKDKLSELFD